MCVNERLAVWKALVQPLICLQSTFSVWFNFFSLILFYQSRSFSHWNVEIDQEYFICDCNPSVLSQRFFFFFLQKSKLLQCYASCPFKTIIAWHLCPSDSLTNMWAGTLPSWQMGGSIGSQETMYLHLVYLLRAGFPVGDVQTSVHPELSRLWIKGCHH